MLRTLDSLDVAGKRVLVRVDFNVSGDGDEVIADDYRIWATIPTIRELKRRGAKAILLLSHRGRPKTRDTEHSLKPAAEYAGKLIAEPIRFVPDCIGDRAEAAARKAEGGAVFLFENLRFHEGETHNDPKFAEALARLGDCFVGDAFGVVHRAHASVALLPTLLPSAAGLLLQRELATLVHLRDEPEPPFVVVLGGAKMVDKLKLIERFLPKVSAFCVGGAVGNAVVKAHGISIGRSYIDPDALAHLNDAVLNDQRLLLPSDVVVTKDLSGSAPVRTCLLRDVHEDERIVDIGPKTVAAFGSVMSNARTIFWNGPMGIAEIPAFRAGTEGIVRAIVSSSAFSVVGGGDTTRYPIKLGVTDQIGFLSTGGGAMMEFLSGVPLPGIEALRA